jgi:hypothetical protein
MDNNTHHECRDARIQPAFCALALPQVVAHRNRDYDVDHRRRREGGFNRPRDVASAGPAADRVSAGVCQGGSIINTGWGRTSRRRALHP